MKKSLIFILALLFVVLYQHPVLAQCAMCKANVESSLKEGSKTAASINSGILYMLGATYGIVMLVGIVVYRKYKRGQAA